MPVIDPLRLEEILAAAADVRAVVVGDLMLDIYLSGSVERISPEAPVPVVHIREESSALGGAANVAANVLQLGASCDVIGFVGADASGEQLRRGLEAIGGSAVRTHLISDGSRPTTTKTRIMARKQQVVRFDREEVADLEIAAVEAIRSLVDAFAREADVLILEDYNKGVLTPEVIRTAISAARDAEVPIIVDPKYRNIFEYTGATVFKPNALELTTALGMPVQPHDDEWLDEARERFECEHLLVTLGEEGMVVRSIDGSTLRVPAIAREVYDVSGAGDTVTAFVAVCLAAGASIHEATLIANCAAAIEVGKPGVAPVSAEELRDFVARASLESYV